MSICILYYRAVYSIPGHVCKYYVLQGGLQYPWSCLIVLCTTGRSSVSLVMSVSIMYNRAVYIIPVMSVCFMYYRAVYIIPVMSVCIMYNRAVYSILGHVCKYYVLQGGLQYPWSCL